MKSDSPGEATRDRRQNRGLQRALLSKGRLIKESRQNGRPCGPLSFALLILVVIATVPLAYAQRGSLSANHASGGALSSNTRKAVVLIHGWTAKKYDQRPSNQFDESPEWVQLINTLGPQLRDDGWSLFTYNWAAAASTGSVGLYLLEGFHNARAAAHNAYHQGVFLAEDLNSSGPNLRHVMFVAHSAGSWVAYRAARELLESNPFVTISVVLLDPFIPGVAEGETFLTTSRMSGLVPPEKSMRVFRCENYFALDNTDLNWAAGGGGGPNSTSQIFLWRTRDVNFLVTCSYVSWGNVAIVYDQHDSPVGFYSDTIIAKEGGAIPSRLAAAENCYSFWDAGIFDSYYFLSDFPRITQQPQSRTFIRPGDTLRLSSGAQKATDLQWLKDGSIVTHSSSQESFLEIPFATANDAGIYVLRARNAVGEYYSDFAEVIVEGLSSPMISSVEPSQFESMAIPGSQFMKIRGSGFSRGTRLTFRDAGNLTHSDRVPTFISENELHYFIAVGETAGQWSVTATDAGGQSNPFPFTVFHPVANLLLIVISGPVLVDDNSTADYAAYAIYKDGSYVPVGANWFLNSGVAQISGNGRLTTSNIDSDTTLRISAVVDFVGGARTAHLDVTIANTSIPVGPCSEAVLVNGKFSHGAHGWTRAFDFYADNRFNNHRSPGGYAYLSNPDGTPGNNLYGELVQRLHLPADASQIVLTYWHHITTEETANVAYDQFAVMMLPASGGVEVVDELDNRDANSGYQKRTVDLSQYAGQTVDLAFAASTDATLPTVFRVDDVDVTAVLPTLTHVAIRTPATAPEAAWVECRLTAVFSDGSKRQVAADSWTVYEVDGWGWLDGAYVNDDELYTGSFYCDTTLRIVARFTHCGVTHEATRDILIIDQSPSIVDVFISGPSAINELQYESYRAYAVYDDGSLMDVTPWCEWLTDDSLWLDGHSWDSSESRQVYAYPEWVPEESEAKQREGRISIVFEDWEWSSCNYPQLRSLSSEMIISIRGPVDFVFQGPSSVIGGTLYTNIQLHALFPDGRMSEYPWSTHYSVHPSEEYGHWAHVSCVSGIPSWQQDCGLVFMDVAEDQLFRIFVYSHGSDIDAGPFEFLVSPGHALLVSAENGSISATPDQLTYLTGTTVTLAAEARPHYEFRGWSGDTGDCIVAHSSLVVVMDGDRSITAHFEPIMTSNGVPHWWIAEYGLLGADPDASALEDSDGDGALNWQEYVAGTCPTNPASVLRVESVGVDEGAEIAIAWPSVPDRVYTLFAMSGIGEGFSEIAHNIPHRISSNHHQATVAQEDVEFFGVSVSFRPLEYQSMQLIPGGPFLLGYRAFVYCDYSSMFEYNGRVQNVHVDAFLIDTYEVTKELWDSVYSWAIDNGYEFENSGDGTGPDHPVHSVNWHDAVKWCNARSEMGDLVPSYYLDDQFTAVYRAGQVNLQNDWVDWRSGGYRLPANLEWEKAARGGYSRRRFPWMHSDTISHDDANYFSYTYDCSTDYDMSHGVGFHPVYVKEEGAGTSPVGSFPPNGYGVYDMAGNVSEWVWDRHLGFDDWTIYEPGFPASDPYGPATTISGERTSRGGGWASSAHDLRISALRAEHMWNWYGGAESGFRCVRAVSATYLR